jgi:hypothetical protein
MVNEHVIMNLVSLSKHSNPHYKKPVIFVMFKKTQEIVQKNRDDVHETSPKIGSTETCKKHGKFALNMDNVYLDVPVLTSPCLVVVIPMSGS